MTQRFPKIDRNFMIESATNKDNNKHRETDDVLRITCGAVDKSDKIAGRKG